MRKVALSVLIFCLTAVHAVWAFDPSEALSDTGLEARAREVSGLVRCPVCQNESIDLSNAPIAQQLRLVVRERIVAGDSNEEVYAYLSARYGEFILLKPAWTGANIALWLTPAAAFFLALGFVVFRRRSNGEGRQQSHEPALSAEEAEALERLLKR